MSEGGTPTMPASDRGTPNTRPSNRDTPDTPASDRNTPDTRASDRNTPDRSTPDTRADDTARDPVAQPVIRVSALLAVDAAGRLLVVRKRGTDVWMQPGGKPEPGESPAQTLARELHEELGVSLDLAQLEPLGTFTTAAANEAGTRLIADVFAAHIDHAVVADAEIDAVMWMHPREFAHHRVAPLITQHMLALMPHGRSGPKADVGTNGSRHEPTTSIP